MIKIVKQVKNSIKKIKICDFIKIDFSFIVIFLLAILLDEIWFYLIYVTFMILHELAHLIVAKKLGYYASKINLSFFGAKLEGEDDFLLRDEIKIVLAGPIFNLFVIIVCYLCFWFEPVTCHYLNDILTANWALLIFNCLPIFPLDLGRLILSVLSLKFDRIKAVEIVKRYSVVLTVFMFAVYLFSFLVVKNFTFGFVCVNLMTLCLSASKDTSFKRGIFIERKFEKLKRGLPEKNIYLPSNVKLYSLFKFIDDSHFVNFIFLSDKLDPVLKMTETEFYKEIKMLE